MVLPPKVLALILLLRSLAVKVWGFNDAESGSGSYLPFRMKFPVQNHTGMQSASRVQPTAVLLE